jgi:hypothetical protein
MKQSMEGSQIDSRVARLASPMVPFAELTTQTRRKCMKSKRKLNPSKKTKSRKPEIPDPDGQNKARAMWAGVAVAAFQSTTGTDDSDAVKDLLCDLMHYCQQNNQDFDVALDSARHHYAAETSPDGMDPDDAPEVAAANIVAKNSRALKDALRNAAELDSTTGDYTYEERVRKLEMEGLCTSDAQAVVDAEDAKEVNRFRNHYRCPDDGTEWSDDWSCRCNDKCPKCGKEIEPYESEDI